MQLPVFKNKQQLKQTNWFNYLSYIYGDIPDTSFPIDINQFDILYTNLIDKFDIELKDKCIQNNNYKPCFHICPTKNKQLYGNMSNVLDMKHTIWIYHEPPYKPIPKNTNVEVTHVTNAFPSQEDLEIVGSWMYKATGSGMFFNTGKTISFQDHSEAARYFLDKDFTCPIREECGDFFQSLFQTAKHNGYDSIQFLGHQDMRCGNTAIEIVDLHGIGDFACGNKKKLNITSGWKGVNRCKCDNKKKSMNCKVNQNMIGGIDLYKIKPYDWITYFNMAYYHKQTAFNYILSFLIYICILIFIYVLITYKIKYTYKYLLFILIMIGSIPLYIYIINNLN